jgi:hypothetical protein
MYSAGRRPVGVSIIALLLGFHGVLALLVMLVGLFTGFFEVVSLLIEGMFGLALLYLAYSMWTLQPWAWVTTLLIEGINAVFAVFIALTVPGAVLYWLIALVAVVIIIYLNRSDVRSAFSIPGAQR